MSVRVMAAVWELDLPPMEKLVLLALADWSNDEGKCWPSATRLAAKTGEGERTVRRVIQSLIGKGFLCQELRSGTSPIYTVDPCQSGTPARAAPLPDRPHTPARAAPNTLGTVSSSEPNGSSPRAKFPPPDGVGAGQWRAFRQQRKKPLNDRAYLLLCNKLRELADDGWPPGDMIDLAIERGWETVFKPRTFANDRHPPSDGLSATSRAAIAVFGSPRAG